MTTTTTGLPAPETARPRTFLVATMFASAAAFMVFAGVVVVYIRERAAARDAGAEWFPDGVIQLGAPGFILATLLLSVVTVQWAVQAINADDRMNAYVAMGLTALFGGAVFNQLWFVIGDTGFALDGSAAEFLFFVVNGTFIAFLIGAVVFLAITFLRALIGSYGPRRAEAVAGAAFYWHTVVAMWAIAWYVIYVTK
jgi:heme/copper-type cytochrome/quinol oxidase subunit 3